MSAPTLLSAAQLARKLDVDPRTLARRLREKGISPDFRTGKGSLYHAARIPEFQALRERPTGIPTIV